jgi:hypothetical protein
VITAAQAPRLVWVQTVAFPSTQEHGYAELGWKELATLVASELATKTDSDVIQVIAEHAALGEQATDEGGPSVGSEGDARTKGMGRRSQGCCASSSKGEREDRTSGR